MYIGIYDKNFIYIQICYANKPICWAVIKQYIVKKDSKVYFNSGEIHVFSVN